MGVFLFTCAGMGAPMKQASSKGYETRYERHDHGALTKHTHYAHLSTELAGTVRAGYETRYETKYDTRCKSMQNTMKLSGTTHL